MEFIAGRGIDLIEMATSRLALDLVPAARMAFLDIKFIVDLGTDSGLRWDDCTYVTSRYGNLVDAYVTDSAAVVERLQTQYIPAIKIHSVPSLGAAVHYHFGSREALAVAVLTRILEPLNSRRRELLDAELAGSEPSFPSLIEALVRPDIEIAHALHARAPGRARLISAVYLRPAEFVEATVAAHFAPVADAYLPHLPRALPDIPSYMIAWRVRWCIFGTIGALLADASAPFERHPDDLVQELVRMFSAALAA